MTHLGELDLASFDRNAEEIMNTPRLDGWATNSDLRVLVINLATQIRGLIRAIRADGLDPRWHPEGDALAGMWVRGGYQENGRINRYQIQLNSQDAQDIVDALHERGYKIVKNAA